MIVAFSFLVWIIVIAVGEVLLIELSRVLNYIFLTMLLSSLQTLLFRDYILLDESWFKVLVVRVSCVSIIVIGHAKASFDVYNAVIDFVRINEVPVMILIHLR